MFFFLAVGAFVLWTQATGGLALFLYLATLGFITFGIYDLVR